MNHRIAIQIGPLAVRWYGLLIWRHRGQTEKAEKVPIGLRGEKRI
jgi:hypothetical protein